MCQRYIVPSQRKMAVTGLANGPSARSTPIRRRVTGLRITRESDSSSRSGAMSPRSTCWNMCAEKR
jgi:hypothetical protein